MERLVITIHPPQPDDGLLPVADAMQQVLDAIRLFDSAESAAASPEQSFEWRLERASTNSPFTVTALAVALRDGVDVSAHARRVKGIVASGLTNLIERNEPASWMEPAVLETARSLFARNLHGIWKTEIAITPDETLVIDRARADAGIRAIGAFDALSVSRDLGPRNAWGEIEGVMLAAGRFKRRPALQIYSELYGFVWCVLSQSLIDQFGSEHQMADVWNSRSIGVRGKLVYAEGGKLSRVEAQEIREIQPAAPIDLETVMDPEFTSGLDPVEYLKRLHEGLLA